MVNNTYLVHHGVKGMKWGVRRYERPDGTLTPRGRKKYIRKSNKLLTKMELKAFDMDSIDRSKLIRENSKDKRIDKKKEKFNKYSNKLNTLLNKIGPETLHTVKVDKVKQAIVMDGYSYVETYKGTHLVDINRIKREDQKLFKKKGISIERDNQQRITSIGAKNANKKQIKTINKMQRRINREGDYIDYNKWKWR